MPINFCSTEQQDSFKNANYITYEDEIHDYLYDLSLYEDVPEGILLLINLDHYEVKNLSNEEVTLIMNGINEILDEVIETEVIDFLKKLYNFFEKSIEEENFIYSVGE